MDYSKEIDEFLEKREVEKSEKSSENQKDDMYDKVFGETELTKDIGF